jgi:hypothetical protein
VTWTLPADRRVLLDLFGNQREALNDVREWVPQLPLPTGTDLLLLWTGDPRRSQHVSWDADRCLPDAIAVDLSRMREFLSWATTVIGGFRPFTAFFKVVGSNLAELAYSRGEPTLGALENAFVGVVLGETLAHSAVAQRSLLGLSLLQCESTYAYTFARACALGYQSSTGSDPVAEPWALARKLTRQPSRRLSDDSIQAALEVLVAVACGSQRRSNIRIPTFIREACGELHARGEVTQSWSLVEGDVGSIGDEMKGTREQRVLAFERVLRSANKLEPQTAAFLTGLLADQIGPGTLEHVDLLAPYLQERPMAAVWYGLCSGLRPKSEVQQVGNCLGRRIARDLLAPDPLVSHPKYDISLSELEVCLDREVPIEFRTASQNHMGIELLPGVPAFVKWPIKEAPPLEAPLSAGTQPLGHQQDLFGSSDVDLVVEGRAALADIDRAMARAKAVFAELSKRGSGERRPRSGERRRRGDRR